MPEGSTASASIAFAQLSAGPSSTCGVSTTGQAYCWGFNEDDRLGTGLTGTITEPAPVQQPTAVAFSSVHLGRLVACGRATTGAAPQAVLAPDGQSSPLSFTDLAVGWFHVCGVAQAGQGWCWGFNGDGQAGPTLVANYGPNRPSAAGSPHVLSQVSVGERHSCAITTSGQAVCWGDNTSGQLGNGTTAASVAPVVLPPPEG